MATMANVAVPKKSCVTDRQRSQMGLIVVCFSRSMNGSGSRPRSSPRVRRNFVVTVEADRRLQVGTIERLAERAAEFTVQADIDLGVRQSRHVLDMAAERKHHIDVRSNALDQPADFGDVGRHVEDAVGRTDDVDPRLYPSRPWLWLGRPTFLRSEFAP